LNPNDNGSINPFKPYYYYSNFNSIELIEDEPDFIIPDLLSSIPPSGRRSLRINNNHINYHVNRVSKRFDVKEDTYYYSFASVMENPIDHIYVQPYFTVKLVRIRDEVILSSKCYVSDKNDPFFDWIPPRSGLNYTPITYRNWTCDTFDLSSYMGDSLRIDFIASDCGAGGHWGYVYLSDLCVTCSSQPTIQLYPLDQGCRDFPPDFIGNLHLDSTYILLDLGLNIYKGGSLVSTIDDPYSHDINSGQFVFKMDTMQFDSLDYGCYDIRAYATLINPKGDTITLLSKTANTNSAIQSDNDFCRSEWICPSIAIDSAAWDCYKDTFDLCGTMSYDSSFTLLDLELEILHDGALVTTINLNPEINDSLYCFGPLTYGMLDSLGYSGYDFRVHGTFTNQDADTVEVYSGDSNAGIDNDWKGCCPEADTITMGFSKQFCLLGQGSDHQHLVGSGTILLNSLPAGLHICGLYPGSFDGAAVTYFSASESGGIFSYEVGIIVDDWSKISADGYFTGSWSLCNNHGDTCAVSVKMRINMSQMGMCGSLEGQMCINYQFLETPPVVYPDGKGNSCTTIKAYFPFDRVYSGEDTCVINQYNVSFYLLTSNQIPQLLLNTTVSSMSHPIIKRLYNILCWPSSKNSYVTGIKMVFTNNCGDSCSITMPLTIVGLKQSGEDIESRASNSSKANSLTCYPNPARNELNIQWQSEQKAVGLIIYNLVGEAIYIDTCDEKDGLRTVNVASQKPGIYRVVVRLKNGDQLSSSVIINRQTK